MNHVKVTMSCLDPELYGSLDDICTWERYYGARKMTTCPAEIAFEEMRKHGARSNRMQDSQLLTDDLTPKTFLSDHPHCGRTAQILQGITLVRDM